MDRQRIVFYYPDFGAQGGIERYIVTVSQWLQSHPDFEPVVICSDNTPLYQAVKASGVQVYGIKTPSIFAKPMLRMVDVFSFVQLRRLMRQIQPDLVHVHIGQLENLWFKRWGYPVIYTFHGYGKLYDLELTHGFKRQVKKWLQPVFQHVMREMDCTVFVSEAERSRMIQQGYVPHAAITRVIPNGINIIALYQESQHTQAIAWRQSQGITSNACCIGFINRLDPVKNPVAFVKWAQAFLRHWIERDRPLYFIIAGAGPLKSAVLKQIHSDPDTQDRFKLIGYVPSVAPVLAACHLVVHIPGSEGFGLGVLEAMATGTPVLAWPVGGIQQLLSGPDFYDCRLQEFSTETLTQQAQKLLTLSPDAENHLKTAMRQRAQQFDITQMTQKLDAAYRAILQTDGPLISILMPAYNAQHTISHAIESVLHQRYCNWELIVIDDGSTDSTADIVSGYADPRIRLIRQANAGVATARNCGFKAAGGEYIAFLDADDQWLPGKLHHDWETVCRYDIPECLVYGQYIVVDEAGQFIRKSAAFDDSGWIADTVMAYEGLFLPSAALVHKNAMIQIGGFSSACYHEDRLFFIRAALQFPAFPSGRWDVLYCRSQEGRCRSVLKDFHTALRAELSIPQTLAVQTDLSDETIEALTTLQRRNLLLRFLIYGEFVSARRLLHHVPIDLLHQTGKGRLALLSFKLGINLLFLARQLSLWFTQKFYRFSTFYAHS